VQYPIDLGATFGRGEVIPVTATFNGTIVYTSRPANSGDKKAVLIAAGSCGIPRASFQLSAISFQPLAVSR
jgi:hypothetical protein